jgi:hypothetical protein
MTLSKELLRPVAGRGCGDNGAEGKSGDKVNLVIEGGDKVNLPVTLHKKIFITINNFFFVLI